MTTLTVLAMVLVAVGSETLPGVIQPTCRTNRQPLPPVEPPELEDAVQFMAKQEEKLQEITLSGETVDGPTQRHRYRFIIDPEQQRKGRDALRHINALRLRARPTGPRTFAAMRSGPCPGGSGDIGSCPDPTTPECPTGALYRTADGTCNNPNHRRVGMKNWPLFRLLESTYEDELHAPTSTGAGGAALPSPRAISQAVITAGETSHQDFTLAGMNWGQFVDHDMVGTPIVNIGGVPCCNSSGLPTPNAPDACLPITIPDTDPFYGPLGRRCMDFVRSLVAGETGCNTSPEAQQSNGHTHFLDGSAIYGASLKHQQQLRSLQGGQLLTQHHQLLPPARGGMCFNTTNVACFSAGDKRVNEQPGLALIHTIWVREHNRVAKALEEMSNSTWDDEKIFQEARKIVIAEYQHIIYNEWLPTLLTEEFMVANGLKMEQGSDYSTKYDSTLSPAITNEFATAAFRYGHSQAAGTIKLFKRCYKLKSSVHLQDMFFDSSLLYSTKTFDELARGLAAQEQPKVDRAFPADVTEHMFQNGADFGLDLVSINIQRGRDHGLVKYNNARVATGSARASTWDDLRSDMPDDAVDALQSVYASVDDVDLFIGGILENHLPGVVLGKTFHGIVGDQFIRLRHGDNFFHDLGGSERPWRLQQQQLRQVRRSSWARVLCDNVDGISRIQPSAFLTAGPDNAVTWCCKLPKVDLKKWRENGDRR